MVEITSGMILQAMASQMVNFDDLLELQTPPNTFYPHESLEEQTTYLL